MTPRGCPLPERAQSPTDPLEGCDRFVFDSDEVAAPERVEMARQLAGQLFGGFHLHPTNVSRFRAGMRAWRAGDVVIGSGYITSAKFDFGSAPTTSSSCSSVRRENEEGIFWIYRRGGATVKQGAVDGIQEAGTAFFMHADMPGIGLTEGAHVLAINLPSNALRRAIGHNHNLGPVALAKGNPLVQLLTGYIDSSWQLPGDTDPAPIPLEIRRSKGYQTSHDRFMCDRGLGTPHSNHRSRPRNHNRSRALD